MPKQQPKMIARKAFVLIAAFACLMVSASNAVSGEAMMLRASLVEASPKQQDERALNEERETAKEKTPKQHSESTTPPETSSGKTEKHPAKTSTETKKTTKKESTKEATPTTETKTKEKESQKGETASAEPGDETVKAATKDAPDASERLQPDESNGTEMGQPDEAKSEEKKDDKAQQVIESKSDEKQTDDTQQEKESNAGEDEKHDESQQKNETEGDETPPGDTSTNKESMVEDPCQEATTCAACVNVTSNRTAEDKMCAWKDNSCQLVSKGGAPSESTCSDESKATENVSKPDRDDNEEGEASFVPGFVTLIIIIGLIWTVRTYVENAGISIPAVGSINTQLPRRSSSHHRGSETYVLFNKMSFLNPTIVASNNARLLASVLVSHSPVWTMMIGDGTILAATLSSHPERSSKKMKI